MSNFKKYTYFHKSYTEQICVENLNHLVKMMSASMGTFHLCHSFFIIAYYGYYG